MPHRSILIYLNILMMIRKMLKFHYWSPLILALTFLSGCGGRGNLVGNYFAEYPDPTKYTDPVELLEDYRQADDNHLIRLNPFFGNPWKDLGVGESYSIYWCPGPFKSPNDLEERFERFCKVKGGIIVGNWCVKDGDKPLYKLGLSDATDKCDKPPQITAAIIRPKGNVSINDPAWNNLARSYGFLTKSEIDIWEAKNAYRKLSEKHKIDKMKTDLLIKEHETMVEMLKPSSIGKIVCSKNKTRLYDSVVYNYGVIIGKAETSKGIQILIQMQGKVISYYSKSLQSELVPIQNSLSVYGDSTTWEFCDVSYY